MVFQIFEDWYVKLLCENFGSIRIFEVSLGDGVKSLYMEIGFLIFLYFNILNTSKQECYENALSTIYKDITI